MKKTTFIKSLLLAAALTVGASFANAETVGNANLNEPTGYLGAHSTVQTIAAGGSMHYVFTQTKATDANYKGWILWAGNTGAEVNWANGISIVRGDNWDDRWPNGTGYGSNAGCTCNFNWDNFNTQMNGATIDMTVSYSGGSLTMTSNITASDKTPFTYSYAKTVTGAPSSIDVCLSVNEAYLNITTAEYTAPAAITGLPTTYTTAFTSTSTAPFIGGEIVVDNNNGNLLRVVAAKDQTATAVAYFDSDTSTEGNQAYALSDGEEVTISFTAYHGYYSYSETNRFAVINSDGTELVSYAYDPNATKVTDVKIGGTTVDGFESFDAISAYDATKNANGFNDGSKPFVNKDGYNPVVTINISKDGTVKINFTQTFKSLDKTFSNTLSNVKMDLANLTITNSISGRDNYSSRVPGFGNITISSATVATVTYKYEDTEGNSLAELVADKTSTETIGTSISGIITSTLTSSFFNGDNSVRYDYKEFSCSDEAVPAAGTTVILKFEAKAKVDYTVKAVDSDNEELAVLGTVSGYAGDNLFMAWSKYIQVNGQWYVTSENSFAMTATASGSKNVTYNTSDIAYFFEMESLNRTGGLFLTETAASYSNNQRLRFSRGSTHYTPALAGGVYTLTIPCANTNEGAGDVKVYTRSSEGTLSEVLYTHSVPKGSNTLNYVITVPDGYSIAFNGSEESSNNNAARLDYMTLTHKTVTATIGATGYSTFSSSYPLDLSTITGATAYYALTVNTTTVSIEPTTAKVPAGEGLLLKGNAGEVVTINTVDEGTAISGNKLVGCITETSLDVNANYYVLVNNNGTAEFQCLDQNAATIPAGKAYLNAVAGARLSIMLNNESSGISSVENADMQNAQYYNLNGQRTLAPQKGLYIVNGKKVVLK